MTVAELMAVLAKANPAAVVVLAAAVEWMRTNGTKGEVAPSH
jgi:hypothetical protein